MIWLRGNYKHGRDYDAAVVGVLRRPSERAGAMRFVDASDDNTRRADGSARGDGADAGSRPRPMVGGTTGQAWAWRRAGLGRRCGHEDAPTLATSAPLADAGTYDIWVNFWAQPSADWRIRWSLRRWHARLPTDELPGGRGRRARPADCFDRFGGTHLYQAYLGRVDVRGRTRGRGGRG